MKLPEERKKFIELIEKGATVTKACKLLNIHRSTFYDWRNNDADFLKAFMEAKVNYKDEIIDAAESHFYKWVLSGDQKAVYRILDTKHVDYMKKPLNILLYKEGDIEQYPVSLDKLELFTILKAWKNTGTYFYADDMDEKIKKEFEDWYNEELNDRMIAFDEANQTNYAKYLPKNYFGK